MLRSLRDLLSLFLVATLLALPPVSVAEEGAAAEDTPEAPAKKTAKKAAKKAEKKAAKEAPVTKTPDVIYLPTPQDVVEQMLDTVGVKKDDILYDLGCGDGRIVVTAAKKVGCKAKGFDVDPKRIAESQENVDKNKVGDLVEIQQKDIFTLDLSEASVVTLYLLPQLNVKLIPQLEKLKPGSRIVSHDFDMAGVEPEKVIKYMSKIDNRSHTIYYWTTPLNKTKVSGDKGKSAAKKAEGKAKGKKKEPEPESAPAGE